MELNHQNKPRQKYVTTSNQCHCGQWTADSILNQPFVFLWATETCKVLTQRSAEGIKQHAHPRFKICRMPLILLQVLFNVSWKSVYELVTDLHPRCLRTLHTRNFFITNHKRSLPSFKAARTPHHKSCLVVERRLMLSPLRHALLLWVRSDLN